MKADIFLLLWRKKKTERENRKRKLANFNQQISNQISNEKKRFVLIIS